MNKIPQISIIVPIYNVELYLEECLKSVLRQSFQNYEVICIDDGSTDGSYEVLKKYAHIDTRIRVFRQENRGLSATRNRGIRLACGEYICFLDGDDMLTADALETMWNAVQQGWPEVLTYETSTLLYENENLKKYSNKDVYYRISNDYTGIKQGRIFLVEMMENDDFVESACLLLIKREWLMDSKLFFVDGMLFEDAGFSIEVYFQCQRMKHIKSHLYIYRVRDSSIMTQEFTSLHQESRIWQFSECLRMIYTYAQSERERKAIAKYAQKCIDSIFFIDNHLCKDEKKKIRELKTPCDLLFKSMRLAGVETEFNQELVLKGMQQEVKDVEQIIIYGAGVIGNKLKVFLEYSHLENRILGFAVTHKIERQYIDNYVVQSIAEYEVKDETLVVIATKPEYHREMADEAIKNGFKKIIVIGYEIEAAMDKKILEWGEVYEG
ncbi:MAG: glycosyltransferase [Agathobacter sp.]|nr:glycosyltransferase [Agathobacter sp.]